MEENTINSPKDLFGNDLEALPKKPEEPVTRPSTSTSEWPSLLASQVNKESLLVASSIPSGQRTPAGPETPVYRSVKKKTPKQSESDRVEKYAPYLKGTDILPIRDLVTELNKEIW